jgi:hypothetical protein
MMDVNRFPTIYEQDFIDDWGRSPLDELTAELRIYAAEEQEKLEADFARQFRESGDDEETASVRASWYAWNLSEAVKELVLCGTWPEHVKLTAIPRASQES